MENSQGKRRDHHEINDDLLELILFHLLPTFLLRLKAVCSRWRKLISDPSFCRRHTAYSLQYHHQTFSSNNSASHFFPSLLFQPHARCNTKPDSEILKRERLVLLHPEHSRSKLKPPDLSFSFIFRNYPDVISLGNSYGFKLLHSSNGLLVLSSVSQQGKNFLVDAFVCNPLTKDYIKLPPMDVHGVAPAAIFACEPAMVATLLGMNLVCDPSPSFHYKVVSVIGINLQQQQQNSLYGLDVYSYYHFKVYSSKSRTWEVSKNYNVGPHASGIVNGVVSNGVIYWPPPLTNDGQGVLRFDLPSLSLQLISLPSPHNCDRLLNYFGESRGNLYLIETYYTNRIPGRLPGHNIWEIKNIGDSLSPWSWTLKFNFTACDILFKPLYVSMNSEEEMLIVLKSGTHMYTLSMRRTSNNPSNPMFEWRYIGEFSLLTPSFYPVHFCDSVPYTSTLFPLV